MENKLYYEDAYQQEFSAKVVENKKLTGDKWAIILDRTAFYPEGGGQPEDHGWINGIPVIDVQEEQGKILHITASPVPLGQVTGKIDWQRRFDHMQQHTGQHILSGVFSALLGADTVGFHLGSEKTHIDLDLDSLTAAECDKVEQAANQAVVNNYKVNCFFIEANDLEKYHLRKGLAKDFASIRLVDIENTDCCPCGGTHVLYTGEIGLIKILGIERHNRAIRVEFLCGNRALKQYRLEHGLLTELSATLSSPLQELTQSVFQLQDRIENMKDQINTLETERTEYLTKILLHDARTISNIKTVASVVENYTSVELTFLGKRCLFEQRRTVVLLAAINSQTGKVHLYFACSPDVDIKMNQLLKKVLPLVDGKGGGNSYAAQGGGTNLKNAEKALEEACFMMKYM